MRGGSSRLAEEKRRRCESNIGCSGSACFLRSSTVEGAMEGGKKPPGQSVIWLNDDRCDMRIVFSLVMGVKMGHIALIRHHILYGASNQM